MNILQLIRSTGFGGAENHVLQLSFGLKQRGHDVLVAAPDNSWVKTRCLEKQIPFTPLAMRGLFDLASYWKLHQLIKIWDADIVHAHQVRPSQYAGIAVKGTRAIPISTAHSTAAYKHMRRCRHIIAVCDAVKDNLVRHHYPAEIITRIYNGVPDFPIGDRSALRAELGITDAQFAVVLSGRFVFDKGQDLIADAVKKANPSIHLYFIGDPDTGFGQQVRAACQDESRIHFLGYRNDVTRLLPAFDLYAAPSRREALSLAIVEAAAASLPCLGARTGGIPEIVADTGVLVPPGDTDAITQALESLANDRTRLRQLGQRARERYEQCFTVERMVAQTEEAYRRVKG